MDKRGRPITWTDEKKQTAITIILEQIGEGKSVRAILDHADREVLPSWPTFNEWMKEDETLVKQYARVCEMRADKIFDEILTIADDGSNDTYTDDEGNTYTNHDVIARSRLRVDARKWALSKMNPKKYGDKTILAGDEENPLIIKQPIFK